MALVSIEELSIRFRGPALLDDVSCQIEHGQKIGLLGRNGAGKTTLMRILAGQVEPDHGQVRWAADASAALLPQDVPLDLTGSIEDVVAGVFSHEERTAPETEWKCRQAVETILSRMKLDATQQVESLSSGMKRRVLLARTLVRKPDLLLLDEPTNHLDLESILWLEGFLSQWPGTLMFVTHDRAFLRKLATRILEVDRGKLFDWSCDYATFLARKEEALATEEKHAAEFDRKLAEEEVWIRQGIKARRTRNEGRVRALKEMRREREERVSQVGQVALKIQEAQRSGNLVAEVQNVGFAYGDRWIVRDFSTLIMRGDKIGIVGPNGAGKTTLLKLLLGQLEPQTGRVRLGANLEIAYFDQLRRQLDEEQSVEFNVADGYDTVQVGGKPQHVIGYLKNFLFTAERARTLVRFLSGGERNRVLLAKLFAKPANVIVLDEPTNDLDAETLEILEQRLVPFSGAVLIVSHDREFLNNVVGSTLAFEEDGVHEYVGGYDDWRRQCELRAARRTAEQDAAAAKKTPPPPESSKRPAAKRKLKYREQQELAGLPRKIEELEAKIDSLHQAMADPAFYQQPGPQIAEAQQQLQAAEEQLHDALARWEELESAGA